MTVALFCHVDAEREADRLALRLDHLRYFAAHSDKVLFGGPTLTEAGAPETMLIVLAVDTVEQGQAFLRDEPYTANGVFSSVDVRRWVQILPELHPGALDAVIAAEMARRG